jgi:Na+/H+ antiporter NhaD/arsenite permease-like protein
MSTPASSQVPRVLYAARPATLPRVVSAVLLAVLALWTVLLTVEALREPTRGRWLIVVFCLVLGTLVGLGLLRPAFLVTPEGLVSRGPLRTRRVAWAEVARVEVGTSVLERGATVVVLRDGRTLVPPITAARRAVFRGESTGDHGHDLRHPAAPTRAAIDAHVRYLRGLGPRS